ncbi:phage head closure protein [Pseudacidovorax sp. RU35E]|uniref:phage head closure protein n=1 Tax=Pseudacidovorax sp. RU35E TaxID=1907403 RepID=UPI0009567C13|nr:phage head closure protein [Pseudacidovorax sp. RU35E]SIQ99942.1 phage head-tail adaptor, putative, SPP1 family [Pseudacidovorax sp. RU35E]
MDIGKLKCQVQLQRRVSATDEAGQPIHTWQALATVWADVRFPGGLEAIRADAQLTVTRASVRIRYRTDVDAASCRLLFKGAVYDIQAVLPDEAHRQYLDLVCESGQNDG